METSPNKEVSNLSITGKLVVDTAARVPSPTLAMRRTLDESRLEIPGRTLRSHLRGGRSSICAQEPPSQIGSFPICRTGSMDRATRPKKPRIKPETLPDRPFPVSVGRNPSPTLLETIRSDILPSRVPTDMSDEASASSHSTPEFHNQPQNPEFYTGSHTEHKTLPTDTQKPHFYTGPTPVTNPTTGPQQNLEFYTGSPHRSQQTATFYIILKNLSL